MENFLVSLEVVLPLCLLMALGYMLKRVLSLNEQWVLTSNKLLFQVLLPLLLMRNMLESDLVGLMTPHALGLIGYTAAAITVSFLILLVLIPRFVQDNARKGVILQGILRANTALFGIPVALSLYGEANLGLFTLLLGAMVPFFNICSIAALELFQGEKPSYKTIATNIIRNPLIIGIAAGAALNLLKLPIPLPIKSAVWGLADTATPLAFLILGASFTFESAKRNRAALMVVVPFRLVLMPLVWVGLAALLGYRGMSLLATAVIFMPPTAVTSYPMACAMGGDGKLAGEIVVFTSALSILTMFFWVFLLKTLYLI
ncbi:MAG: Membrane transport protein [Firmicutes bacterium ADurb.Bin356]|nr:MAG: Membrane transport protein [Firmicutes bacterium ADurb.Bin356]